MLGESLKCIIDWPTMPTPLTPKNGRGPTFRCCGGAGVCLCLSLKAAMWPCLGGCGWTSERWLSGVPGKPAPAHSLPRSGQG